MMAITTAKAAPELMPRRSGEASGLLVAACMIAPATASAAPTRSPASTRGSLAKITTMWSREPSYRMSASTTLPAGIGVVPMVKAQMAASATTQASASSDRVRALSPLLQGPAMLTLMAALGPFRAY
jgi:hypothetical protein